MARENWVQQEAVVCVIVVVKMENSSWGNHRLGVGTLFVVMYAQGRVKAQAN